MAILSQMVKFQLLDDTFAALSDPTRREILKRLTQGPASISELAGARGMSLPGLMKHVQILERADLVRSEKRGRIRECQLGPGRLDDAVHWLEWYRRQWERRLDGLEAHLDIKKGAI